MNETKNDKKQYKTSEKKRAYQNEYNRTRREERHAAAVVDAWLDAIDGCVAQIATLMQHLDDLADTSLPDTSPLVALAASLSSATAALTARYAPYLHACQQERRQQERQTLQQERQQSIQQQLCTASNHWSPSSATTSSAENTTPSWCAARGRRTCSSQGRSSTTKSRRGDGSGG